LRTGVPRTRSIRRKETTFRPGPDRMECLAYVTRRAACLAFQRHAGVLVNTHRPTVMRATRDIHLLKWENDSPCYERVSAHDNLTSLCQFPSRPVSTKKPNFSSQAGFLDTVGSETHGGRAHRLRHRLTTSLRPTIRCCSASRGVFRVWLSAYPIFDCTSQHSALRPQEAQ
jgi:hypothetical protein